MAIHYVTTNKGKVVSLRDALSPIGLEVFQLPLEIPEIRSSDTKEIALAKVEYAYKQTGKSVVCVDGGFFIDSLKGFPRAYCNFILETIGVDGILKLVEGLDRSCEFRDCLAYKEGSTDPITFVSSICGSIAPEKRGVMQKHLWSELALIFIPEGKTKTLAEMSKDEYDLWKEKERKTLSCSQMFANWLADRL